jgi:hypothetical protein
MRVQPIGAAYRTGPPVLPPPARRATGSLWQVRKERVDRGAWYQEPMIYEAY